MFTTTTTTTIFLRRIGAPMAVAALALAACGGSDDDSSDGGSSDDASAAESDAGSSDDGGDTAAASDDGASDDSGSDADSGDDVTGAGSNDETQEVFDDLGVDLDLDELEETVNNLSTGEGGGTVTIDGAAYTFVADICISQGPTFVAEGPGTGPDGQPAWVGVEYAADFDFDGDGTNEETADVSVEVGKTELFGESPDDQPRWFASSFDLASEGADGMTVDFGGETISGSGPIFDNNFVVVTDGSPVPMTFEASCT